MKCVILGCGRVGSMLAVQLSCEGHDVSVIDKSRDSFRRLGPKYKGQQIYGTGIDGDVLRRAGIESADAFVAVTQGDNTNIMAAQVVKEKFHVPKILCRVYDPSRSQVFRELGIRTMPTAKVISGIFHDTLVDDPYHSVASYLGEDEPEAAPAVSEGE